jgi:chromosome segregation ATPase
MEGETIIPIESEEDRAAAESFRTNTESRLAKLESSSGTVPVESEEDRAAAESFRTNTESRLAKLESSSGTVPAVDGDGSAVAGLLRTFETRIQQMETNVAENTSANLRLADAVATLQTAVKALQQPPGQ